MDNTGVRDPIVQDNLEVDDATNPLSQLVRNLDNNGGPPNENVHAKRMFLVYLSAQSFFDDYQDRRRGVRRAVVLNALQDQRAKQQAAQAANRIQPAPSAGGGSSAPLPSGGAGPVPVPVPVPGSAPVPAQDASGSDSSAAVPQPGAGGSSGGDNTNAQRAPQNPFNPQASGIDAGQDIYTDAAGNRSLIPRFTPSLNLTRDPPAPIINPSTADQGIKGKTKRKP